MQQLPQESRTQTILRDKHFDELINARPEPEAGEQKFGPWALINYQIAKQTDAINQLYYVVATGKRIDPKSAPPEPTPRPGMKRLARKTLDSAEAEAARRYLDEFNRGVAA